MAGPVPIPAGGPGGTVSVRPADLYAASALTAGDQSTYDDGATRLVSGVSGHEQLAGNGDGPAAFAAAYAEVAALFLQVWAAGVVSVGGVAVGLTVTANNYAAADWHSDPKRQGPPPSWPVPRVIERPPHYGTVADLTYRGTGQGSSWEIVRVAGRFPDWLAGSLQEGIEQGLRLGKLYDITPSALADQGALVAVADCWLTAAQTAENAATAFSGTIDGISDQNNGAWRDAMNAFCQTIWGTTAWGTARVGQEWGTDPAATGRRPVISVLSSTARAVSTACHDLLDAARNVTDFAEKAAEKAAEGMVDDVLDSLENPLSDLADLTPVGSVKIAAQCVAGFRAHMDYDGVNHAVDEFNARVHDIARSLLAHREALEEALRSAPTFRTEDARAEGYGARSLESFKDARPATHPQGSPQGVYHVDLAAEEGIDGAHTLDKHVGKTDAQLAQRLRDQSDPPTQTWPDGKPVIGAASTFISIDKAQEFTQYDIDQNSSAIQDWLKGPPTRPEKFDTTLPAGQTSGYMVSKQPVGNHGGFKNDGMNATSIPVNRVRTVLKYDKNLDPPFVVLTSMPI